MFITTFDPGSTFAKSPPESENDQLLLHDGPLPPSQVWDGSPPHPQTCTVQFIAITGRGTTKPVEMNFVFPRETALIQEFPHGPLTHVVLVRVSCFATNSRSNAIASGLSGTDCCVPSPSLDDRIAVCLRDFDIEPSGHHLHSGSGFETPDGRQPSCADYVLAKERSL